MKVVVGQGSCGIATGAKKTSDEFQRITAEKNLNNVVIDKAGCIGTCYLGLSLTYIMTKALLTRMCKMYYR